MEESSKRKRKINEHRIRNLNNGEFSFYHGEIPLQRHEEVRLPRSPEPIHITRQEEGLLQNLGKIGRLPSLGLPKGRVPRDGSAVQFEPRRPGALPPSKCSLISVVYGLFPFISRLFAFLLLFGLLRSDLTLLQFIDWPFPPQVWNGL